MTSTADTTQHPDVSEISDLAEGLLPTSRAADIRQHLSGCPLCTDVQHSLNEIRGMLGTLPPQHMPADIADRIDAALAVETTRVATPPEEAAHVSRETSSVAPAGRSTRASRPAGRPPTGTGPGRAQSVRHRRRRSAVIGAAFGAAVIGMGAFFLQSAPSNDDSTSASRSADSGAPVFAEAGLQSQVRSLLATSSDTATAITPKEQKAPSVHTDSSPNTLKRGTAVAVPSCIERGIGRDAAPLALQQGTYHGTAAFLVVLPYPSDSSRVQAYVVDASCVDATPPARGKILLTHTYPRS